MATHTIRAEVRRRLFDLLNLNPAAGTVYYAQPRGNFPNACVWLGGIEGTQDIAGLVSGRKSRDDEFQIEVVCWVYVGGDATGEEADTAVVALIGAVEDVVADDAVLRLNGVTVSGLTSAKCGLAEGPTPFPHDKGYAATARLVVTCRSRIN